MTTAKTPKAPPGFELPDVTEIPDEKMTASQRLSLTGGAHFLAVHLGNSESTVFGAERYITPNTDHTDMTGAVCPDLLVAFEADPALYLAHNGYVISEPGKPPDLVLEVASRSAGRRDSVDKRVIYAQLGLPEYWRFDETGQYHGTRLAGDRLSGDGCQPIAIEELPDGSRRGHSAILNVELRWTDGRPGWHDPEPVNTSPPWSLNGWLWPKSGQRASGSGRHACKPNPELRNSKTSFANCAADDHGSERPIPQLRHSSPHRPGAQTCLAH